MATVTTPPIAEIAASLGLTEHELFRQALVSFLHEKKRQTLQLQLETLTRYGADSIADLESKIAQGVVAEHPAWDDLIVVENLTARLGELEAYKTLANIALSEFTDVIVNAQVMSLPTGDPLKLRLDIVDGSLLDVFLSDSGRYSYHWGRSPGISVYIEGWLANRNCRLTFFQLP